MAFAAASVRHPPRKERFIAVFNELYRLITTEFISRSVVVNFTSSYETDPNDRNGERWRPGVVEECRNAALRNFSNWILWARACKFLLVTNGSDSSSWKLWQLVDVKCPSTCEVIGAHRENFKNIRHVMRGQISLTLRKRIVFHVTLCISLKLSH